MLVFIVKCYINKSGTDKVLAWCDKATEIGLASIALPEILAAYCRLHREARISDAQYWRLKLLLMADIEDAALCNLAPAVLAKAVSSLEKNMMRGLDAITIDSAVVLKAGIFVSSNKTPARRN